MVLQGETNHPARENLKAEALERGHVPIRFKVAPEHGDAEEVRFRVAGSVRSTDRYEEMSPRPKPACNSTKKRLVRGRWMSV